MVDNETVIAERRIDLGTDPLDIRISTHTDEGFWRVQVHNQASAREVSTTTVDGDDSFLWPLIRDAVAGDGASWQHLAHWGHGAMIGRAAGFARDLIPSACPLGAPLAPQGRAGRGAGLPEEPTRGSPAPPG